jgi:peroxiredoxin
MAVETPPPELGAACPDFRLPAVDGKTYARDDFAGKSVLVVMFICNHCPYVKHVNAELVRVASDYGSKGIGFVAISANDVASHPEDAPDKMKLVAKQLGYPFPYLYDESQKVARAYMAACTPDLFLFDAGLACVYRGQFDGSRPGKGVPDGGDLRAALDALLAGKAPLADQKPSVGCNIKWKP